MNDVIQSLWIGSHLTAMERLAITSFLDAGHAFHLYAYEDVANVPPGAIVKDGRSLLPESMIFRYAQHNSYAGFSNYFRYKLLLEAGGWWVDTDVVCLRPFHFDEPYVLASEADHGRRAVSSAVIKAPAGCPLMAFAWETCADKDPRNLMWGETGPRLLGAAVSRFDLQHHVRPPHVFCPIAYTDWQQQLDPRATWDFPEDTYAIHLWNEMWRRGAFDKEHAYDRNCLYEQLRRRFQTTPAPSADAVATEETSTQSNDHYSV